MTAILGPDGRPFVRESSPEKKRLFGFTNTSSYDTALRGARGTASLRAASPLLNHPYAGAAISRIATMAMQAPFLIWNERRGFTGSRVVRCGRNRMAVRRNLEKPLLRRVGHLSRNAEPVIDSPLSRLLWRPNPYQDGAALIYVTVTQILGAGQVFWAYTDDDGNLVAAGPTATRIWPITSTRVAPIFENGSAGSVVGYELSLPRWWPGAVYDGQKRVANIAELSCFTLPHPEDILIGLSRLGPAAAQILQDLSLTANDQDILNKGGVPRTILEPPDTVSVEEHAAFELEFREKYLGEDGEKTLGKLPPGYKLHQIQFTGSDLNALPREEANAKAILALIGMSPSMLLGTQGESYASALVHLKSVWGDTVQPILSLIERAFDATALFLEGDNIFAGFDYSEIEALRAGLEEKAALAEKFAGPNLRMPPRVALEMAGIEAPRYEGDEIVLVSPVLSTIDAVISGDLLGGDPPVGADPESAPASSGDPLADVSDAADQLRPKARWLVRTRKRAKWKDLMVLQGLGEIRTRNAYRGWVRKFRDAALAEFDKAAKKKRGLSGAWYRDDFIDITKVVPDLSELRGDLRLRSQAAVEKFWRKVYGFTSEIDFGGTAVIEIDSPLIDAAIDRRQAILLAHTPPTLHANIRSALEKGIKEGETVQEIRLRLNRAFQNALSPSKSLSVARTHAMGVMNDVRDQMFEAEDAGPESWIAAQDEHTREDHVVFGDAGPKDRGFNFLDLVGQTDGVLAYPHDPRAPARQKINCRCAKGIA